jgi:hypothetical protein
VLHRYLSFLSPRGCLEELLTLLSIGKMAGETLVEIVARGCLRGFSTNPHRGYGSEIVSEMPSGLL